MSMNKFGSKDSNPGIIRSMSLISLGTFSSRVLGFVRDVILAKLLGTSMRADAFFVALRIPNLFRDMVGEGAANSAVVPVLSEYAEKKSKEEFWRFVSVIFVLALMILSVLTLLGIGAAPLLVRMIAPGFIGDPDKLSLTVRLTRLMFPYLVFIGLTAYAMGVLYTFRSFLVPAFAPCLLNVALIASAFFAMRTSFEPVLALAAGVLIGGAAQLIVQIGPLVRRGLRFTRPGSLDHPGARRIGRLLLPRLFGSAVYQLTVLVDTFCASLAFIVGAGGISAVYYANRVVQFPMGVFSVAIASAILPALSGFAARGDIPELKKTLDFALRNIILIMVPFSIFLVLMAAPLVRVFFQRGAFGRYSTDITSWALLFYALGLLSFSGIKIMVTAFHALQDTKTPVRIAALCLFLNIVLNILLMKPLKVGGIALASSLAATVDFVLLFRILRRRLGPLADGLLAFSLRVLAASGVMGLAAYGTWSTLTAVPEIPRLALAHIAAFLAFWGACTILKIDQLKDIFRWIVTKD